MNNPSRLLIRECIRNKFSTSEIIQFLRNSLLEECPCERTIYYWIKKFRNGETSLDDNYRTGRPQNQNLNNRIRTILRRNKFSSTRSIGRATKTSHMTISNRLKKHFKMKRLKLRVVPHPLNQGFMNRRSTVALSLLKQLKTIQPFNVITSVESWFYFSYHANSMWVKEKNEVLEVESRFQNSRKAMLCIFWSLENFLMLRILPEETTYNTDYVVNTLLPDLEEAALSTRPVKGLKSYYLHWDNARPHYSKDTTKEVNKKFKGLLVHPPYSPDLAPSDFFLFGYLKRELEGKEINDENQLKEELEVAFRKIKRQKKLEVFEEWKRRLSNAMKR